MQGNTVVLYGSPEIAKYSTSLHFSVVTTFSVATHAHMYFEKKITNENFPLLGKKAYSGQVKISRLFRQLGDDIPYIFSINCFLNQSNYFNLVSVKINTEHVNGEETYL